MKEFHPCPAQSLRIVNISQPFAIVWINSDICTQRLTAEDTSPSHALHDAFWQGFPLMWCHTEISSSSCLSLWGSPSLPQWQSTWGQSPIWRLGNPHPLSPMLQKLGKEMVIKSDILKCNPVFFPISFILLCDLQAKQWSSVLGPENHSLMFTRHWDNRRRET